MLPVVETFYSLQGEGAHTGVPAFFIRTAGCRNGCPFCDTPHSWTTDGFPVFDEEQLALRAQASGARACVVTGGEPLLHNLDALCAELHRAGLRTWLETSGSEPLSGSWDWICLSPKKNIPVRKEIYAAASELKVVVGGKDDFAFASAQAALVGKDCKLYLQPEWGAEGVSEPLMRRTVGFILEHPLWRLSLQTHKYSGIQ